VKDIRTALRLTAVIAALLFSACKSSQPPSPTTQPMPALNERPQAAASQRQQWLDMFARSYFPGRSGQVYVIPKQGWFVTSRDPLYYYMHGSPWDYDVRIPILFYGAPFVKGGSFSAAAKQQDIAPTVGAMIGAASLPTYTGRVLNEAIASGNGRPRIVTVIVLDAMRADYFDTHASVMPTLTRMRKEGAWFSNARTVVLPTVTGVGHANIGTGSEPRFHGITVNNLFNRTTGKPQEAYNRLDTQELMALTLADNWNLQTDGKAVIVGQGGAIRAVAGLVGRGACLISGKKILGASYGGPDGGWETNDTCYTKPAVLDQFVGRRIWEAAGGKWMGHDIASAQKFRASALFQKYEAEALLAVINDSQVGADEITDLVYVNMKGPDYTAHAHGPASNEQRETLTELDKQLAAYLALIDKKAGGPGRTVTIITADHGMPNEPPAGGRLYLDQIIDQLKKKFDATGQFINYYDDAANNQLHLDTARLQSLGFSLRDVAAFLEGLDAFEAAFTEDEVKAAQARLPK
jgi:Type I phosphodiesterase / nucleotide pyrophosphatase